MSAELIERLQAGIRAAHEAGNTEQVRRLGTELRRIQAQSSQQEEQPEAPQQEVSSNPFRDFRTAWRSNVDPILEGMGTTAEVLGYEGAAGFLRGATEAPENYASPSERFTNADEDGSFAWRYLPGAIGEQLGQFGGSLAARTIGAGAGAGIGAFGGPQAAAGGAIAGAIAGPALFEAAQVLGPVAMERARRNGRETPNQEDLAWAATTAAGQGALNALAPGVRGAIQRALTEGVTEGAQSIVQQTGESLGTEEGLEISGRDAVAEGIIGFGSAGAVDGTVSAVERVGQTVAGSSANLRYDNREFSEDEVRAAQRLLEAADGDMSVLGNVDDTDNGSALSAANAALRQIRAETDVIARDLRALARDQGSREAEASLNALLKTVRHQGSTTPDSFQQDLIAAYNALQASGFSHSDVMRLRSLANQTNTIQNFTKGGKNDMGGFSKLTSRFDITDPRSTTSLGGIAVAASGSVSTAGTMIAANRAARLIDRLTNRRSRVKRFVESAQRSGVKPQEITGPTAADALSELRQRRAAQKAAQQFAVDQAKERAKGQNPQGRPLDQSKAQAQAERDAYRFRTNEVATKGVFDTGQVPANDDFFNTYRFMQEQTGLDPNQALEVIRQLETEGVVAPNTAQRFVQDPMSFTKEEAIPLQRAVRAKGNPGFTPRPPEAVVRKIQAVQGNLTSDRRRQKAREGDRRYRNLVADIEAAEASLSADQMQTLYDLAESINSPGVTRAERFRLVEDILTDLFPDNRAMVELWRKKFSPLAAIGNDYAIEREQAEQDPVEAQKEEQFQQRVERAAKSQRRKRGGKATGPVQLELDLRPTEDPGDRALRKLREGRQTQTEQKTAGQEAQDAKEPQPRQERSGQRRKLRIKDRVQDRVDQINHSIELAANEGDALDAYIQNLPKSSEGRVERIFYGLANDRMTQNMVSETFASEFDIPVVEAARIVNDALVSMEAQGLVRRIMPKFNDRLRFDGKTARDAEGNPLDVVQIEVIDQGLKDRIEVAKAVRQVENMVNQDGEVESFTPNRNQIGAHRALKDPPSTGVDGSFTPIFNFLNSLRSNPLSVSNRMLTQIEEALEATSERRVGTIGEQLLPETKTPGRRDESPLRTVAQLLFQLGNKDERGSTQVHQEWTAGANLRVYSKNGLAHSQAGDIMKGLLRMPQRSPVGGETGLNFLLHGIGNILGYNKGAPIDRRNAIFDNDLVDSLMKFAENPFGRTTLTNSRGQRTKIGQVVKAGEGFFQVLNAAHEVRDMVNWARERHSGKSKLSNSQLLQDPEVRADMAENYSTDMIVQLDASNNAYQIIGLVMGYEDVLRATGVLPPINQSGDPDTLQGADLYMEPALSIAERVPEIQALDLPASSLRNLFKRPIGTYTYAAEFSSRREAFQEVLEDIASPANPFGFTDDDLITIPQSVVDGMRSDEGYTFMSVEFDINGDVKREVPVRSRVVERDGRYVVSTAKGGGQFTYGLRRYNSAEEAILETYSTDLYSRMNRELVRDMNTRYPGMRQYLDFAKTVSEIVKNRGGERVRVPTKDGMMLEYSFKQNPQFVAVPVELGNGRVARLGVRTDDYKLAGRGLAAFMTHQNDAWALRETYRRLQEQSPLKGFNPIHDSYGFHPSDAGRGQETWVQVMQELGAEDYNIFLQILEANGISIPEYVAAGGDKDFILNRRGVAPVPARSIPTALS